MGSGGWGISATYSRNRSGDNGDPWGTPYVMGKGLDSCRLIEIRAERFERKEAMKRT